MILKSYELDKNINSKIFLFHGINEGQKEEIIEKSLNHYLEKIYSSI